MSYIIDAMGYEEMDGTLAPRPDTIVTGSYCMDCGGAATAACSGGYPRQPDRHRVLCAGNTAYDSVPSAM